MSESIGRWCGLEAELGYDVGWQQGGNLMLFESEAELRARQQEPQ